MVKPLRKPFHLVMIIFLTLLTQLGGIAWAISRIFKRKLTAFVLAYVTLSAAAVFIAPHFGRVPLECYGSSPMQVQNLLYCALNRNYVTPELKIVTENLAEHMEASYPGTVTLVLDANFPFIDGFSLLPHLSHKDGRKVDIAFWYQKAGQYLRGQTRSPIGYFAFENGPTDCPETWLTLRWNFAFLQPFWRSVELDAERTKAALSWLARDPRVEKVFIEPHLRERLGETNPKIRFQGCRAARHDDHIHFQI